MRRISFALMSTLAALVLLLSYRTSSGAGGTAATAVSSAHVVGSATAATATGAAGPQPRRVGASPTTTSAAPRTTSARPSAPRSRSAASSTSSSTVPSTTGHPPTSTVAPAAVTVQGATEMTQYGAVQVQVTIAGHRITDVTALAYPDGSGRDQEINAVAVPALRNQVLRAQSTRVDGVSGATYTTQGFLASVQSALDAAGFAS